VEHRWIAGVDCGLEILQVEGLHDGVLRRDARRLQCRDQRRPAARRLRFRHEQHAILEFVQDIGEQGRRYVGSEGPAPAPRVDA